MLGWFRALMPKEERFFELFTRHAQVTLTGAEALWGLRMMLQRRMQGRARRMSGMMRMPGMKRRRV